MSFGEKLKNLRKSENLTQKQLAERIGVAKSIVSYYESGHRYPSYDVLVKIAHVFHVSTDYLLDMEKRRVLDVSDLPEESIAVLEVVANALRGNRKE